MQEVNLTNQNPAEPLLHDRERREGEERLRVCTQPRTTKTGATNSEPKTERAKAWTYEQTGLHDAVESTAPPSTHGAKAHEQGRSALKNPTKTGSNQHEMLLNFA
jgi:hypothetical protein